MKRDHEETFKVLRCHCVKLNLKKCVFRVISNKFLGFIVNQRAIEADLDKYQPNCDHVVR